ncbi:MAG: SseB family protein [Terrimesophilobacter sp.]
MADSSRFTDSAGQPWAGRQFSSNDSAADDGSAPAELLAAIDAFHNGTAGLELVVDQVRTCRLLIPLVAKAGEEGVNDHGVTIDKTQELSIVTVSGPDGRNVLPVFSSVEAMSSWNPQARPVPASGPRIALAAANENTDLVVIDPTSPSEVAIRRPALWAIGKGEQWLPGHRSAPLAAEFDRLSFREDEVKRVELSDGDPRSRLTGPELRVTLTLIDGLDQDALNALLARLSLAWSTSELIAAQVDSLEIKLEN